MPGSRSPDRSPAAVPLAHVEEGDGPALLLLAGLGSDRDFWKAHLPILAGRFRVIVPDPRGSGESPAPDGPYSVAEMAGDALALLDRLGIEKAFVAGHSLGGMVALQMALSAPGRVRSLVLAATGARPHPLTLFCLDVAGKLWESGCAPDLLVRTFLTWTASGAVLASPEKVRRAVEEQLRPRVPQSLAAWRAQAAAVSTVDLGGRLREIGCPSLVVAGEEDSLLPVALSRELAEGIPGARFHEVAGAGHNFPAEDPSRFCETLQEFFAG
jgi:3-oxoadipate enol-lactonase